MGYFDYFIEDAKANPSKKDGLRQKNIPDNTCLWQFKRKSKHVVFHSGNGPFTAQCK